MDAVFMTRYRSDVGPLNGWIGHDPGYYDSVRIPGARIHIDPGPAEGYLRAITGDLGFTTTAWRGVNAAPADTTAPVVSKVRAMGASDTITAANVKVPVFTPNGDGLSDSIAVAYRLSEGAFLELKVKRDGKLIRRQSSWAQAGPAKVTWNGRRDNGTFAAEGNYNVSLTPTDRAGNRGAAKVAPVRLLNSIKSPSASRELFWARDGDALVPATVLRAKLTRSATVSWVIRNRSGKVVRRGIDGKARGPGVVRFAWDGKNDAGKYVLDGRYTARIRVVRPNGSYAHDVTVRHMPFMAWTPSWTRVRGDTVTLKITTTEPLRGKPVVTANQRGIAKYTVPPRRIKRISPTEFKIVIKTRNKGKAGGMKVRVKGTDKQGGTNSKVFIIRLK